MPQSLLVRAKDAQGNSVMMVINPDSLTEVTRAGTQEPHQAQGSAPRRRNPGRTEQSDPRARPKYNSCR